MSYQVIARKWRPQAFGEVTGQEHITQTLRNAIEFDRLHHAYLFAGARGVGKTTTARLLAKALNCHKTEKPNINPCKSTDPDPCPSCVEISESRSIDVLEFDAASNTQVEKIREIILEGIQIAPARDRFKIFIIDEVHQLSGHSFNALLKTVEEPPPGVVFIMATTELHKVPETITSRCQEFIFRTIPQQKIFERLKVIGGAEGIDVSENALRELARSGEGSMRDAQSNFDQVISFSTARIEVADVTRALGMAGRDVLVKSIKAIAEHDARSQIEVVEQLISEGHDLRNFCRDLLSVIRDLMVFKVAGNSDILLEGAMLEPEQVTALAAHFSESDLLRFFNSVAQTESSQKDATQPRYTLELGLVRLVEMRRLTPIDKIIERLAALEKAFGTAPETPLSQAAAAAEKKTLNSEISVPPVESPEVFINTVPEEPFFAEPPPEVVYDETDGEPLPAESRYDLSFLDKLPVRLADISTERLEHHDHERLDNAYEELLYRSGDQRPLENVVGLIAAFGEEKAFSVSAGASNGSNERLSPSKVLDTPTTSTVEPAPDIPVPTLGENPTDDELKAYAEAHPIIKRVAAALHAQVISARKIGNS